MAKSARTSAKGGETHYNRKEKQGPAGRSAGGGESEGERPERKPRSAGERKPFARKDAGDRKRSSGEDRPYARKREDGGSEGPARKSYGDKKPFRKDGDRPFERKSSGDKKPFSRDGDRPYERKPFGDKRAPTGGAREERSGDRPYKKPFSKDGDSKPYSRDRGDKKPYEKRSDKPFEGSREDGGERPAKRPYTKREDTGAPRPERTRKPIARKSEGEGSGDKRKSFGSRKEGGDKPFSRRPAGGDKRPFERRPATGKPFVKKDAGFDGEEFAEHSNPAKPGKWDTEAKAGPMTLNKYLAHSGVSSRRDAAAMIKEGKVEVNGKVLTEPGYRVQPGDKVTMDGTAMNPQRHFVYVLLNKPKDFLTTTEDDRGRRTVMELVSGATDDRLYPIGRLDRNTTGVLLLTNDGDLAQKLSHPKYESKKIYQVTLDKDVTKRDFDQIVAGVELEDGLAKVDRLAYLDKKNEIGLEIHSGRNRIVRRIFESLGYDVEKLDRVMYAGLTKKNVSRGKWRFLTEKEVITLKHFKS